MPCWLLLLNDAGFPLFSRSYGMPSSAFSFPTMGLLSAVHSSAGNSGFAVTRLSSHDAHIRYRMFTGGLILVIATSDTHVGEEESHDRMGHIYDALVFLIGRHKIQELRNVERTKRQIRSASNLMSLFLLEDSYLLQMGTGIPECCIASNSDIFAHLRTLAQACNTLHAAFYAQHRLYAWTDEWSQLDSRDLFTIACFLRSCTPAQARDVPVYLAHSSLGAAANAANIGKTPYRLLTISLVNELELVLLCGTTPALVDAMQIVQRTIVTGSPSPPPTAASHFKSPSRTLSTMHADILNGCSDFPRHVPNSFSFHADILGFLFLWQAPAAPGDTATQRRQDRMVSSFLPTAPHLPTPVPEKGRRSPSPLRTPRRSREPSLDPPPSPSQFAPNNPLFSGSLLSESSVLNRSHALLGFYYLVRDELTVTPQQPVDGVRSSAAADRDPSSATDQMLPSPSPTSRRQMQQGETTTKQTNDTPPIEDAKTITDAYMLTPTRGFYACRRGPHSLYVMYSEKVPQPQHAIIARQLMDQLGTITQRR